MDNLIPGLRPSLTETAFQAENPKFMRFFLEFAHRRTTITFARLRNPRDAVMRSIKFLSPFLLLIMIPAARADFPEPDLLPVRIELPDPLVMLDGTRVTTKEQWFEKRRPELKALFQHYMYGEVPSFPVKVEAAVRYNDAKAFGGKATLKEITLSFAPDAPPIYLLFVVPNHVKGPVPVFIGPNFCGNHCLVSDPNIHIPEGWMYPNYPGVKNNRASEDGRGKQIDVWASINRSIVAMRWPRSTAATWTRIAPTNAKGCGPIWRRRRETGDDCGVDMGHSPLRRFSRHAKGNRSEAHCRGWPFAHG